MIEAYWISPDNTIIPVPIRHIYTVFDYPEKFGLSLDYIKSEYNLSKEKYRIEGKARGRLFRKLFDNGWIRIRYDANKHAWKINFSREIADIRSAIHKWIVEYNILFDNPDFRFLKADYPTLLIRNDIALKFISDDEYFNSKGYIKRCCFNCNSFQRYYLQGYFCVNKEKIKLDASKLGNREVFRMPNHDYVCEFHHFRDDSCSVCDLKKFNKT